MGDASTAAALRAELLSSLDRWRSALPTTLAGERGSTAWFGVGDRAIAITNSLIRVAVETLWPEEPLPPRPTLGHRIDIIQRLGGKSLTSCTQGSIRLVSKADLAVLQRYSRLRASFAHQEDQGLRPDSLGRPTAARVVEILDEAEAITRSTLVDEAICRQEGRAGSRGTGPE